jgi:F0F1-type ATP synthase membrane subunit b/b'
VEIAKRNAEIKALQKELDDIVASAEGSEENIIAEEVEKKRRQAAIKLRQAQRDLNDIQRKRFVEIEQLRSLLQNINTWSAPAVILIIAVFLSIRRSVLRRRYVSHASDA